VSALQIYSTYKESGFEWIGRIPAHWQACRTKFVATLYSGHTPSRDKPEYWVAEECTIPWFTLADVWQLRDGTRTYLGDTSEKISPIGLTNSAARLLPAGTVIVSRTASVGFAGIMPRPMATTQDFVNWVCGDRIRPQFLLHVFRAMSGEFSRLTMGSTHQTIYMPDVRSFSTPLPPLDEQEEIIAFLDRATARIDGLIAKERRLIELLREKRLAIISHAVAAHSTESTAKLGYSVDLLPGFAFPSEGFSSDDADMRLLRGVNVSTVGIRWEDTVRWPLADAKQLQRFALREGDVVLGMDRPWIGTGVRVARIGSCDIPSLLLQRVARLRARAGFDLDFLELVLKSAQFKAYFEPEMTGVSVPHISPEQILSYRTGLPPLDQQRSIVQGVRGKVTSIDGAVGCAERAIGKLEEHRAALIAAAVTGKIDVHAHPADAVEAAD
jgi:type I restriction enzyme S subunit